jgi:hypothetical protein
MDNIRPSRVDINLDRYCDDFTSQRPSRATIALLQHEPPYFYEHP